MTSSQYFDPSPDVASRPGVVSLALVDMSLTLATDRGVFSGSGVDPGTRLLLQEAPPPARGGDLLDLGCGYGPIAVTMARRAPASTVWAIDVNARARALCAQNASANGCPNVKVTEPHLVDGTVAFATIWSNPPIRIGKSALHELLGRWLPRLTPDGEAILVVGKHLGSDSLATWLTGIGYDVDRLVARQGYRLLRVTRAASS